MIRPNDPIRLNSIIDAIDSEIFRILRLDEKPTKSVVVRGELHRKSNHSGWSPLYWFIDWLIDWLIDWCFTTCQHKIGHLVPIYQDTIRLKWTRQSRLLDSDWFVWSLLRSHECELYVQERLTFFFLYTFWGLSYCTSFRFVFISFVICIMHCCIYYFGLNQNFGMQFHFYNDKR